MYTMVAKKLLQDTVVIFDKCQKEQFGRDGFALESYSLFFTLLNDFGGFG